MQHRNLLASEELLTLVNTSNALIQEPVIEYDEPLVKFVNQTLKYALELKASDIHIEPFQAQCRIRFRQDGLLKNISEIPILLFHRVVMRLKVLAKLNIGEKRLPQDGKFQFIIEEKKIDVRISVCPTQFGEKIVLRLLNCHYMKLEINKLGLNAAQQKIFIDKISASKGLILVTGPTGSGKTVTLYSVLHYLNSENKNIVSVEDPIEIDLPGINQVNVQPSIGLTFKTILRSLLRQDPDIIMVGEIRDKQTAAIALHAAQTGHLVLATLHANNTYETFARLESFQLPRYDIINAITLVVAQRLVRKKIKSTYDGRIAIFECLPLSENFREQIKDSFSKNFFLEYMKKNNFLTLQECGAQLVAANITDEKELKRVLSS